MVTRRESSNRFGAGIIVAVLTMFLAACGSSGTIETVAERAADDVAEAVVDVTDTAEQAAGAVAADSEDEPAEPAAADEPESDEPESEEVEEVGAVDVPDEEAEFEAAGDTAGQGQSVAAPSDDFVFVDLFEWGLAVPATAPAGPQSYVVANTGDFKHELAIARGASYADLPQLASGAVDEDALGDAFIGRTETFAGGKTIEVLFDLEPGEYVFYCNIAVGPNSHAANGQVASVSVG